MDRCAAQHIDFKMKLVFRGDLDSILLTKVLAGQTADRMIALFCLYRPSKLRNSFNCTYHQMHYGKTQAQQTNSGINYEELWLRLWSGIPKQSEHAHLKDRG